MTWFKVDDSFPQHPKVLRIPRVKRIACVGLWGLAGPWCARNLTDGYLDENMVEELGGSKKQADELVRVGLWERVDGGFQFHDWSDWQPTRARVEERRDAEARRKQEWRDRKRSAREQTEDVPAGQGPDTTRDSDGTDADVRSTRPDPTRPDPDTPNGVSSGPRSGAATDRRGTRLPDDFAVSDEMRSWAAEQGWADRWVDSVTERFVDYWRAKAGRDATKTDWPATWRNWLRREAERGQPVAAAAGTSPRQLPSWEL
ncbi:hypothetical protein QOZ88_05850 [Blastococcus sp. BMG 814]|uniref:Uncharacterized protein n=1 Tax=Blastococcus carthaginiensis TaxID=3050034 RepID=A0ABT9I9A7_9ACTN|nr:hypothetical protein [Blastococcus carthaginiensis]MDP5182153.1 hypothetical protein [Blastococcus carthaginiensis]